MAVCSSAAFAFPELLPISDLRQRQNEILQLLRNGPVILTQHGRAAAVMVSPDQWREILTELEDLQDAVSAAEAYEEFKNDPEGGRPWEAVKADLVRGPGMHATTNPIQATSLDPLAARLADLRALFPDAFTEGRVDFDRLRAALGDLVDSSPS